MNRELEDFLYQIETMDTKDLTAHALDDAWLAELCDEELIALIHEMVSRFPNDSEEDDWDDWEEEIDEDERW